MASEQIVHTPHPALTSSLVWRQTGSGRPLVLLHGGHGSWAHWVRNMEALSQTHTVVSVDMPMYGDSGHLLGGMVAAKLHRMLNTRRMVLIGSAGHGGKWRRFVELRKWEVNDPAEREAALKHNLVPFMLEHPASMDEQTYLIHKHACENTHYRSRPVSLTLSIDENLRSSPTPTLFFWGQHDVTCHASKVGPGWVGLLNNAEGTLCRTRAIGRSMKSHLGELSHARLAVHHEPFTNASAEKLLNRFFFHQLDQSTLRL